MSKFKNIFRYSLFLLIFGIVFSTCKKNVEDVESKYILLSGANVSFLSDANTTQKFIIKTNTSWVINVSEEWLSVTQKYGKGTTEVEIKCDVNKTNTYRIAYISVSSPDIIETKEINIYQLGTDKTLMAEIVPKKIISYKGDEIPVINIISNMQWKVETKSTWFKAKDYIGANISEVPVIVDINLSTRPRKDSVFVISLDKNFPKIIGMEIEQAGAPCDDKLNNCPNPPTSFQIIHPAKNSSIAKNEPCSGFLDEMMIDWTESIDPEGQAVLYDVYLDKDPDPKTLIAKNLKDLFFKYDFTALLTGNYYVKVIAKDPALNKTTSPISNFKITESKIYTQIETVAGNNGEGNGQNQLNYPSDLFVANNLDIYIADQSNFRIQLWKYGAKTGVTVAQGKGNMKFLPHSVFFDNKETLYISDYYQPTISSSFSQRILKWKVGSTKGEVIAGGEGAGDRLTQLYIPYGIFVTKSGLIYACDAANNRVLRFYPGGNLFGDVVAGGNGQGSGLNQLHGPHNLFVTENLDMYIADEFNNRVIFWKNGAMEGEVVAGDNSSNAQSGNAKNQLENPRSVIVDKCGNIYVVDYGNKRIVKWKQGDYSAGGEVISGTNLKSPHSMVLSPNGDIYVSEDEENLIQRWYR